MVALKSRRNLVEREVEKREVDCTVREEKEEERENIMEEQQEVQGEEKENLSVLSDPEIVVLFAQRSQGAISALNDKYGKLCKYIAKNILNNEEDAEECINDSYFAFWEQVPPKNPDPIVAYLSRLVRNISIKRYHANTAQKRNKTYDLALEELVDMISGGESLEDVVIGQELGELLNEFLRQEKDEVQVLFVRRYFYGESVADIADKYGLKPNSVTVTLKRARKRLEEFLLKKEWL